jgi:hypothetical protein
LVRATILASFRFSAIHSFSPLRGFFSAAGVLLWALAFSVDTLKMVFLSGDLELIRNLCLHRLPSLIVGILMNRLGPKNPFFVILLVLVLAWFRASVVRESLLAVLETMTEDKKGFKRDSHLLVTYLRKLCQRSNIERSKLRPILLKIGAIEHDEIARAPLFLTNHNPDPMTVTIDVGEVEGINIALGRDASQGRGDGNNILDYLPKQSTLLHKSERHSLVKEGRHEGHPLNGLRQFLLSNEETLHQYLSIDSVAME